MSRHKFVKALNLDDELDEFDGASEEEFEEELSSEDKEQLRRGTGQVRQTLGADFPATDREIEDSLYYYYYDVSKTVNYLLNQKTGVTNKKPSKNIKENHKPQGTSDDNMDCTSGFPTAPPCAAPLTAADFFRDAPWLNIPQDRQAEILLEPLYPRGRLLGGSSKSGDGPPKSKLAALAAARKRENRNPDQTRQVTSSVALLDKLKRKTEESEQKLPTALDETTDRGKQVRTLEPKKYPIRPRRRSSSPPVNKDETVEAIMSDNLDNAKDHAYRVPPRAAPSIFAKAMFGPALSSEPPSPTASNSCTLALHSRQNTDLGAFAGPSPDDVVLKAQASAKGAKPNGVKQNKDAKPSASKENPSSVTQAMKDVKIADDAPKLKRKHIDVAAEYAKSKPKKSANFVVIGHVDAGKSTLMGRLLHDLKAVDQRTVDKYRTEAEKIGKASFALAWVMDQGSEERERGVTIDIANFKFETATTSFTILDAPGHRDFVPNMIAGASQADFAILVIDASTGNFESGLKGQTKEHALLVRSMGVQRVIIAVNKLDTIDWSKDRFDEISQQISAFLTAAGFQAKNLAFVPCSGLTGDNIVKKTNNQQASWYEGKPLVELLEDSEPTTRAVEKPLRLTIDNVFRGGAQNPISISGRIDAGTVQLGDNILIQPASHTASVKSLDVDNEPTDWAVAGQNVVLHLTDIDSNYLKAGDVISPPSQPVSSVKSFTVKVLAFEHMMPMPCEIHRGRLHAPGRVAKLEAVLDKASGAPVKGKKPKLVKPGNVARVRVEVDEAIPLESGNRVILRAEGETIGAGLVE